MENQPMLKEATGWLEFNSLDLAFYSFRLAETRNPYRV